MEEIKTHTDTLIIDRLMIIEIFTKAKREICSYLGVEDYQFNDILKNFIIQSELSGHNNQICLIDCYNNEKKLLGTICLKYSFDKKMMRGLAMESNILKILCDNKILVPKVLDSNSLIESNFSYVVMENTEGKPVNNFDLNLDDINRIFDAIQLHESILSSNLEMLKDQTLITNLSKEIDFKKKILTFLHDYVPDFKILNPLDFLNDSLNNIGVIDERKIITDRSAENIFKKENGEIALIDFSTVRIGTQFDNWIQFIDDPRMHFSYSKEKLIQMFFKRNNLRNKDLKLFYIASIYTNLLQGIFTYGKNPGLGIKYFENVNTSFMKLENKKGVLIDISHQHAPQQD